MAPPPPPAAQQTDQQCVQQQQKLDQEQAALNADSQRLVQQLMQGQSRVQPRQLLQQLTQNQAHENRLLQSRMQLAQMCVLKKR
jgi:hypothetical protein